MRSCHLWRSFFVSLSTGSGNSALLVAKLKIEGTEQTGPDLALIQAILTLSIVGNAVLITWGRQGFSAFLDMLEIQVDRGDGKGWVFLTYDTTPNYTDTAPLPVTPMKWKYRAIYRLGDAQVGQWSNTMEITVG